MLVDPDKFHTRPARVLARKIIQEIEKLKEAGIAKASEAPHEHAQRVGTVLGLRLAVKLLEEAEKETVAAHSPQSQ
ncbi:hypothetical protein ACELLULO517_07720 [Acidisoma cellulosilytica]|uniref:Uncharacterized protein n=1 Tax=Acidisoma cellulosilyticum TaxID=2802395 RepID=A0A963Z072_9PROT|nr:hypothetical protein [Acidisoma cellulosilyticum]MCB8880119.1 hypothetical protein [Acidisoma cellulosilyticum]